MKSVNHYAAVLTKIKTKTGLKSLILRFARGQGFEPR